MSFLTLPRPIVTCILCERTVNEAVATIKNGEFDGAHAFAIHLELLGAKNLTNENLRRIAQASSKPIMFLHYRGSKKWPCPMSDVERADMFDASPLEFTRNQEAIDLQREYIDRAHELVGEVVMSSHV